MSDAITPFWFGGPIYDILFALLLCLMLLPALVATRVDSFWAKVGDALLYNRGHIFFHAIAREWPTRLFHALGALQFHCLIAVNGYLLLDLYGLLPPDLLLWEQGGCVLGVAIVSLVLSMVSLLMTKMLAAVYLPIEVYRQWHRHYIILQWLAPLPLYISAFMILAGSLTTVAPWVVVVSLIFWRLALILPTISWLHRANISLLLISLYLCTQEFAPVVYIILGLIRIGGGL